MIFSSKQAPIIAAVSLVVLTALIGVVVVESAIKRYNRYDRYDKKDFIDSSTYQAVFLNNDQIYFGRLKNASSDYLILYDAHYVKINEDGAAQLVKLGVIEPHSPQDKMIIGREQILYWENLKPNSQVIEKIKTLQSQ